MSNTRSSYNSLVRATVKARPDGRFSINCFTDNSRKVVGNFNEIYYEPIEFIDRNLSIIKNIAEEYLNYISRWHNQPEYVEIWVEKDPIMLIKLAIVEAMKR